LAPVQASAEEDEVEVPSSYALDTGEWTGAAYQARAQIDNYADLVRASYAKSAADAAMLGEAVDALLADPDEATLAAARYAWLNARVSYLQTEAFRFYDGPIEAVEGRINAWPLNEAFIDYVAGDPDSGLVNATDIALDRDAIVGRDQITDESDVTTGWHAIEFLLWGQDRSDIGPGARPASDYVAGRGNNDRRRTYLRIVTTMLADDLSALADAWDRGRAGTYGAWFVALDPREALGRIINGMAVLAGFELMSERLAVGLDSGDQEDEHSCFSDNTHNDFIYDLRSVRNVYYGDFGEHTGPGLDELVRAVDPALDVRIAGLINRAESAIAEIDRPFDRVLATPPGSPQRAEAEAAVAALVDLAAGLREVGQALGVRVMLPA
jgi:putative iron-regulated protein